jgi:NIPSNAP
MLIEHRAYTLNLGATDLFWNAQRERGEHGLRPILDRLIGAFATRSGTTDQIVSLYRYDSFDDWQTRLFGLYAEPTLQPYLRAVRPLIVRQESRFLMPAPLPELTPRWGNGRDWLPGHGPVFASPRAANIVDELTLSFAAGGVPACWEAFRKHALTDDPVVTTGLFGGFSSIAGALNQVLLYWHFPDVQAWSAHRASLLESVRWKGFLRTMAPSTVAAESKILAPSEVADMSPLFGEPECLRADALGG